ncbi:hypothetical protein LINPERPRIM_LOCUS31297 [Linum perenne]
MLHQSSEENLNPFLLSLARTPDKRVTYFPSYYINGFRFHTKAREQSRRSQNSGVMVRGENDEGIPYYGGFCVMALLKEISRRQVLGLSLWIPKVELWMV